MTRTPTVKSMSRVSKNEAVLISASFSFLTLETAAIRKECRQKKKSNCSAHLFEHVRVLWHSSLNILNNLFIKSKCFQECSATGISPDTTDSLFRFLEDHSNKEPRRSGMFHDTCSVTSEDQEQLEKAVACLVKIIHLIHHANLSNQHQVCKLCHWFKWIILQVTVHSCGKS